MVYKLFDSTATTHSTFNLRVLERLTNKVELIFTYISPFPKNLGNC